MKTKYNLPLLICFTCLLISCNTIKNQAIESSKKMVKYLFSDTTNQVFQNYLYVPVQGLVYCRISIYKNKARHENITRDINTNISEEYKDIKDSYGKIDKYTITSITYRHHWFPMWDYGYPHSITIIVNAEYKNIKTKEIIEAYYIKHIKAIQIVDYLIVEEPIQEN